MVGRGGLRARGAARARRAAVKGHLVVCPTPIGNLEDITLRVLAALREADVVACEDTRRTRILLDRYGVNAKLVSYHEHNEPERSAELVRRMHGGETVALVSDAGMPLVSDPGLRARPCLRRRRPRGRGAAGAERRARGARRQRAALGPVAVRRLPARASAASSRRLFASPETVVAFESPRRVAASLAVLAELDPARKRRRLPGADEGPRGGRPRHRRRAGRALRGRAAAGRGGARRRSGAAARRCRSGSRARRRCAGWWRPGAKPRVAAERRRRAHRHERQRPLPRPHGPVLTRRGRSTPEPLHPRDT